MAKMTNAKKSLLVIIIALLVAFSSLMALFSGSFGKNSASSNLIRVACVGDSITEGSGYPEDLQIMLGANYQVENFGVSGSTVLLNSEMPYLNQAACKKSQVFQPSIVILMLGTNDAKVATSEFIDNFSEDYKTLISEYQALESNPEIWLVKPPPILENDLDLSDANLQQDVIPKIEQIANELNLPTIDVYAAFAYFPEYFMDGVHPSSEGAAVIANEVSQALS